MKKLLVFCFMTGMMLIAMSCFAADFKIGDRVAADWHGSRYLAEITGILANDTFKVRYFDNTNGDVPGQNIRLIEKKPALSNGDRVLGAWQGKPKMYPGTLIQIKGSKYKVKWDDGSAPSFVNANEIVKYF